MKTVNKHLPASIVLIVFYLLSFQSTLAQAMCHIDEYKLGTIKLEVVSNGPKGYEPIPEAKVELWKYSKKENENNVLLFSGKTDKNGFITVESIKKGEYVLLVSKEEWGFQEFRTAIKKVNQTKKSKHLWIRLGVGMFSEGCGDSKLVD